MEVKIRISEIEERLDRAYDIDDLPMIEMLESRLAVVRAANGEKRKNGKEKSA